MTGRTGGNAAGRMLPFAPFAVLSVVHVAALAAGATGTAAITKLLLMPLLAVAVLWGLRAQRAAHDARPAGEVSPARDVRPTLLIVAVALSWLGDGAGTFFPFAPELPVMLLAFGAAHLVYIWLFQRHLATRRPPVWSLVYALWWVGMLVALFPATGTMVIALGVYGLVLGGTALSATRVNPTTALGGVFFLTSDSILAFRLFVPEAMPDWTSPAVMATYCLGQGLLAYGVLRALAAAEPIRDDEREAADA